MLTESDWLRPAQSLIYLESWKNEICLCALGKVLSMRTLRRHYTQKTTWDFKVISNETLYKTKTKYNYAENVFYFHVTEYLSPKPFDKS